MAFQKGNKFWKLRKENVAGFKGKHHSEKTKLKISQNKLRSENISKACKGIKKPWLSERNKSKEMRKKASKGNKGKNLGSLQISIIIITNITSEKLTESKYFTNFLTLS